MNSYTKWAYRKKVWDLSNHVDIWKAFEKHAQAWDYYEYNHLKKLSDNFERIIQKHSTIGKYTPYRITKKMLSSKKLNELFINDFYELLEFKNLEEIEELYVKECNFLVYPKELKLSSLKERFGNVDAKNYSKAHKVYKLLPNIKIKKLSIRFMKGHLSFLNFLNLSIKEINVFHCCRMNDFDFSFLNKFKKMPKFNLYIFDDEEGGQVRFRDIEEAKEKIMLSSKKRFKFGYTYRIQLYPEDYPEDTDLQTINDRHYQKVETNWYPIIKKLQSKYD